MVAAEFFAQSPLGLGTQFILDMEPGRPKRTAVHKDHGVRGHLATRAHDIVKTPSRSHWTSGGREPSCQCGHSFLVGPDAASVQLIDLFPAEHLAGPPGPNTIAAGRYRKPVFVRGEPAVGGTPNQAGFDQPVFRRRDRFPVELREVP